MARVGLRVAGVALVPIGSLHGRQDGASKGCAEHARTDPVVMSGGRQHRYSLADRNDHRAASRVEQGAR